MIISRHGLAALLSFCVCSNGARAWSATSTTASTQPSSTQPSSQPTTRVASPAANPLATPVSAVEYMLKLAKAEDFEALHNVDLQMGASTELRAKFAPVIKWYRTGYRVSVLSSKQDKAVASVICELVDSEGERRQVFSVMTVMRFDEWKVEIGAPAARRLTSGERDSIMKLEDWRRQRLAELRSTTRPSEPR